MQVRSASKHAERPLKSYWLSTSYMLEILNTQYGPRDCTHRSADIALVAGGNRKRWIIATENMQPEDIIKTSAVIGRMAGSTLHQI